MFTRIRKTIRKVFTTSEAKPGKVLKADPVVDHDETFHKIYNACIAYTMTSKLRIYALYKAVEYIVRGNIPGDFVECGVWKGGSAMVIAHTLLELNVTDRKIYLYDTFEGMPPSTDDDRLLSDINIRAEDYSKEELKKNTDWCYSSQTEVRANLQGTKYPEDKIIFVQGKVEDTIPETIPAQIAILRLDTDWYASTRHELIHLYPLLSRHGVLIIDDYGWWSGSKKAVDEYFLDKPILLNRIDNSGRIGIKSM